MKLTIQFPINNGTGVFVGEASSIVEFDAIRDYLTKNGLASAAKPADNGPATDAAAASTVKEGTKPAAGGKGKAKADAEPKSEKSADAAPAADTAKTAAGPTIEDVVAVMTKVADEFGVPEALILNKRFGCKKAGELKQEQYAEYIAFASQCLAEKKAPSASHAEPQDATDLV